jgi:hypothetical protein
MSLITNLLRFTFLSLNDKTMPEVEIRFSPEQTTGSFRLLTLAPDLCKLIESSADDLRLVLPWSIMLLDYF